MDPSNISNGGGEEEEEGQVVQVIGDYDEGGVQRGDLSTKLSQFRETNKAIGFQLSTNLGDVQKSIEGWVLIIRGINEEASESEVVDKFADFGSIKNIIMPQSIKTGFMKGYALVEFESKTSAESAITSLNGSEWLGRTIEVSWAFTIGAHEVEATKQTAKKQWIQQQKRKAKIAQRNSSNNAEYYNQNGNGDEDINSSRGGRGGRGSRGGRGRRSTGRAGRYLPY